MYRIRLNRRRGAFQLLFSVVYLVVGSSFFFMPSTPSRDAAFSWLPSWLTLAPFAALWVVAGLVAGVCAFLPRPKDAAGFVSLVVAPGVWFILFMLSAGFTGTLFPLLSGIVYGAFSAVPIIVSGMQGENDRDHRQVAR